MPPPRIDFVVLQRCQRLLNSIWLQYYSEGPTNYPCNSVLAQDLQRLGSKMLSPPASTTFQAAVDRLCGLHDTSIELSQRRLACLRRLRILQELDTRKEWFADIPFKVSNPPCAQIPADKYPFKIFHDLDTALFDRRLSGNVCMAWNWFSGVPRAPLPRLQCGKGYTFNLQDRRREKRVEIGLDASALLFKERGEISIWEMLDTLIHHMTVRVNLRNPEMGWLMFLSFPCRTACIPTCYDGVGLGSGGCAGRSPWCALPKMLGRCSWHFV